MSRQSLDQEELEVTAMIEEYRTLRAEIQRCISIQYQTIIAGGVILGACLTLRGEVSTVFLVIPLITIIITSLWLIEQSRMMRAGNYLQVLEDRINEALSAACMFWENWLRMKEEPRFSSHHYRAQGIGVFGAMALIETIGLVGMWLYRDLLFPNLIMSKSILISILSIFTAIYVLLTIYIVRLGIAVIRHKGQAKDELRNTITDYEKSLL